LSNPVKHRVGSVNKQWTSQTSNALINLVQYTKKFGDLNSKTKSFYHELHFPASPNKNFKRNILCKKSNFLQGKFTNTIQTWFKFPLN